MDEGVAEFFRLYKQQHNNILQDSTKRVKNSLVRRAPVAEGQYVSEFDVGVNRIPADTKPPFDPGKRKTRARLQKPIDDIEMGDVVYFDNQDPAARALEFGYSKKAPQGVLRITARSWRRFVKGAARAAQNRIKKTIISK